RKRFSINNPKRGTTDAQRPVSSFLVWGQTSQDDFRPRWARRRLALEVFSGPDRAGASKNQGAFRLKLRLKPPSLLLMVGPQRTRPPATCLSQVPRGDSRSQFPRLTACQCVSLAFRSSGQSQQLGEFWGRSGRKSVTAVTDVSGCDQGRSGEVSVLWVTTPPRSAHLSVRGFAKLKKLFLVMPSMHEVKLPPLWGSQWTENRMVEQLHLASESGFTLRDDCVHRRQFCPNLVSHLLCRQAPRLGDRGGFSSAGHMAQFHYHEGQHALSQGRFRRERFAFSYDSFESVDRSGVAQVKMFQHLRRTPLPREMPAQLLAGHAFHC